MTKYSAAGASSTGSVVVQNQTRRGLVNVRTTARKRGKRESGFIVDGAEW